MIRCLRAAVDIPLGLSMMELPKRGAVIPSLYAAGGNRVFLPVNTDEDVAMDYVKSFNAHKINVTVDL